MKQYLFVYGTLLPNQAPHGVGEIMGELSPVAEGSMPGRVYDLGAFPGAVFDDAARAHVRGRVFEAPMDDAQWRQLDAYEEYLPEHPASSLFVREKRPITLADGSELPCWVYLYNRDPGHARPVPGGDYSAWAADRQGSHSP